MQESLAKFSHFLKIHRNKQNVQQSQIQYCCFEQKNFNLYRNYQVFYRELPPPSQKPILFLPNMSV